MSETDILRRLGDDLGERLVTDGPAFEAVHSDKSGWSSPGRALAVVQAQSVADVQAALRLAAEFRVPVVPRGAGTGVAAGAIATEGALVVSTAAMDRILEISLEDELAVVEPGVLNQALSDAVAPSGLVFSPDPASKAISSIGGNIATNAGGLLCAKYGVTREAVLGLAVVLPGGRLLRTGRRSVKGVTGYDLTALLTGSEGTLGVIVEATVKLRPIPAGPVVTLGAYFPSVVAAAAASAAITAARLRPAVMELMDEAALAAIARYTGVRLDRGSAYLLVQTDGGGAAEEARRILEIVTACGGEAEATEDPAEGEALLAVRRAFHPALEAEGDVLIEDVCVPRSALPAMFAAIRGIEERTGLSIPTVAHAGDGNLHPNFVLPAGTDVVGEGVWEAAAELFRTALALGGTLTGEHGVGLLKRRWLAEELGDDSLALQRGIKAVFDPLGIMNPGKMF
ncbi:FAD-binding oxidoreductase [Rathayibacter iranicus]|uniref:FAD-binding protein n=2 Tax=Rathayibacter iranicus TaxID=59737 RepID=A0AAD1ELC7_9MICO|nr:FAD-linked oxidase C-terminal domain-containing protein [Rathayibacter iranicus]AZZ54883.1 FAD-binding protein [Rathayibacter iranicus]MWV31462.1 FAD-binding protein [Rathayibacter iranicus NCPPB 2253 = VKM Ac-1602]PPI50294.1 FAD-binding oxidoreductase [Rathayibacter iranicus]PPI62506.1 FAD-binding oxidoreductase [Rathayibacter iranicus]PPI73566.1 FAD-binding oxidoreductase [Rathayibacter iranicus]